MDTEYKYDKQDLFEMIFLTKRREKLMSISEHIVIEYLYHNRLLELTTDEKKKTLQMREQLTKLLIEFDN